MPIHGTLNKNIPKFKTKFKTINNKLWLITTIKILIFKSKHKVLHRLVSKTIFQQKNCNIQTIKSHRIRFYNMVHTVQTIHHKRKN